MGARSLSSVGKTNKTEKNPVSRKRHLSQEDVGASAQAAGNQVVNAISDALSGAVTSVAPESASGADTNGSSNSGSSSVADVVVSGSRPDSSNTPYSQSNSLPLPQVSTPHGSMETVTVPGERSSWSETGSVTMG